jgi:hypothetical protein
MNDTTTEWMINRLAELRSEYTAGNTRLTELGRQREELWVAILRVEGAIRILEEQVAQVASFAKPTEQDVGVG